MSIQNTPILRYLNQIAVREESPRTSQEKPLKKETIVKIKEFIFEEGGFGQWVAWAFGVDAKTKAKESVRAYVYERLNLSKDTILALTARIDRASTISPLRNRNRIFEAQIGEFLNQIGNHHSRKTDVEANFWDLQSARLVERGRALMNAYEEEKRGEALQNARNAYYLSREDYHSPI